MKIFLSYASEDREIAEEIQLALSGAGHLVFYDKASLPPAGDYHGRIQQAVQEADVFVFLISPDSVGKGNYALTELKFARDKWPHPKGRVIPVRLHETPFASIPAYLKSVTVLEPEGNIAAEVAATVAAVARETGRPLTPPREAAGVESPPGPPARASRRKKIAIALTAFAAAALVIDNWDAIVPDGSGLPPAMPPVADEMPAAGMQGLTAPNTNAPASAPPAIASADQTEAAKAANEILLSIRNGDFEKLWSTQTSSFFRSRFPREMFINNLALGRQRLGPVLHSQFVDMAYTQQDPATGVRGEIYAFNYVTAYGPGSFYERIVVVKESDGRFRLAGIWSAPASQPLAAPAVR